MEAISEKYSKINSIENERKINKKRVYTLLLLSRVSFLSYRLLVSEGRKQAKREKPNFQKDCFGE